MQTRTVHPRRHALQVLGGIALSSLTACCSLRPFPDNKIEGDPPTGISVNPILRPRSINSSKKPAKFCLDAHTHFFNASDVNVEGYLKGPVAHTIRDAKIRQFVEHMSPVVDSLAGIAPTASAEHQYLLKQMAMPRMLYRATDKHPLDNEADKLRESLAVEIFKEMSKRNLGDEYLELEVERSPIWGFSVEGKDYREFSVETVLQAIDPKRRRERQIRTLGVEQAEGLPTSDATGVLEFVGHMLSYRWMSLRTYQSFCTESQSSIGIDGVFSALVDFDFFLDCAPRSSREDQVKLHSLLSLISGGYLLPLVGYNPWTDILNQDASLKLVKRAVLDYGFVGVKIYPPIGFYPYGNEHLSNSSPLPRPDLKALDEKLLAMFSWCAQEGVPVMAHTGESMGRDDPSDEFSKPEAWSALLSEFDGRKPPVINAGHFGGDEPKEGFPENSWPELFAKIAAKAEGASLYGDLGYWSAVQRCSPVTSHCNTAIERLTRAIAANPSMINRLMYGTDWFMLSKEKGWASYPQAIAKELAGLIPLEKLFHENVMACFGLGKGGAQRKRVLSRLAGVKGGPPAWLAEG